MFQTGDVVYGEGKLEGEALEGVRVAVELDDGGRLELEERKRWGPD